MNECGAFTGWYPFDGDFIDQFFRKKTIYWWLSYLHSGWIVQLIAWLTVRNTVWVGTLRLTTATSFARLVLSQTKKDVDPPKVHVRSDAVFSEKKHCGLRNEWPAAHSRRHIYVTLYNRSQKYFQRRKRDRKTITNERDFPKIKKRNFHVATGLTVFFTANSMAGTALSAKTPVIKFTHSVWVRFSSLFPLTLTMTWPTLSWPLMWAQPFGCTQQGKDPEQTWESTVLSRYVGSLQPGPHGHRSCGMNPINQSSQSWLFVNQSINQPKGLHWKSTLDWLI